MITGVIPTPLFAMTFALRGWFPWWLAVILGLLAVVAVAFVYLREAGRVTLWRRALLAGLRATTLCSILFLLLKPSLLWEMKYDRPRPIAVIVDDSQSMLVRDPRPGFVDRWRVAMAFNQIAPDKSMPTLPSAGDIPNDTPDQPTRLDIAKATLTNPRLKLLEKLKAIGPVQPAAFGGSRSAKDARDDNWVKSLGGKEPRTAIADSVFDLLKRDDNELPNAIVLVTDGRENSSQRGLPELARECARLQVPLHIYGIGSSSFGQVTIRDVTVPETLFVDDTVSVPVRYRVRGFKDGKAEIIVKLNGREVARKIIDLNDGDEGREVLPFVPVLSDVQPGKQELSTSIHILNEPDKVVDEVNKSVRVVDRKMKVLVVDSIPRWDFKYLQRALMRDRRVDAKFWLSQGDKEAMNAGPPFLPGFPATREELFAYDLLVFGDLPASALTPTQLETIRDFVVEGGGFIHIAGRVAGPATFVNTPLADVLPVEFQAATFPIDSGNRAQSFRPELTPLGVRSAVLRLDDDPVESVRIWRSLPEIYWHYPVTKLKPGCETLLAHPTAKTTDGKPMPLLAAHYYGKGYAVFCGFDESWRWRYNEADRFFGRYWSQTVYLTGVPRTLGTKLTQLSLDTLDPQLGKTGQVYARLFKSDLSPQLAEQVEASIERLDVGPGDKDRTTRVTLRRLPGQTGDFITTLSFNTAGRFNLVVDNGGNPGTLEYRVMLPPDHELSVGGMAEDELRTLAERSGGKFYREEDLVTLSTSIKPKTVPITQREETVLWNIWSLLVVIALFSFEWFFRKFNSLS